MHLLAAQPGALDDGSEAIDLGQTPGDIVFLSAADTELAALAEAHRLNRGAGADRSVPSLRLANLMHLGHNMSVDLYVEDVLAGAKLIIARILGGQGYWTYGVEQLSRLAQDKNIPLALLPGDDKPDPDLAALSTVPQATYDRLWAYLVHGGVDNSRSCLSYAATLIGIDADWLEPEPLAEAGLYWPGQAAPNLAALRTHWAENQPIATIVFYRALVQAGNTAVIDALIAGLQKNSVNPLPIYIKGLKDPVSASFLETLHQAAPPAVILNGTGFAVSSPGVGRTPTPFDTADCPILQVVFSGGTRDAWVDGMQGLSARDIAMNVALPEVDGRILSRAVSFKGSAVRDGATQLDIVRYEAEVSRIDFVAKLAAAWTRLKTTPAQDRRVLVVLANYPNRDGRLGNGVGLDTPAAAINILTTLQRAGYHVEGLPEDGDALITHLQAGPTNDLAALASREVRESLSLESYSKFFKTLPDIVQSQVLARWGDPSEDPYVKLGVFRLSLFRLGNIAVGLQPARGYNIDPKATYHDPDLVPPHAYLAFYAWARAHQGDGGFDAQAVIHLGKHGNLEWLPGKALALSDSCFPEVAVGPLPNLYPFIVNDPGEGTQAKRRTAAVIIDHLTPPLTRAETYGPLKDLEALVDEYYEAASVDARRLKVLGREILSLTRVAGLDQDCGIAEDDSEDDALNKLDNYLCELKELQIRDGLHIFGTAPEGRLLTDLLVALVRVPRGSQPADASLLRTLAEDLEIAEYFDPLSTPLGETWEGPRPALLESLLDAPWRTVGDTVERLEILAAGLINGDIDPLPERKATAPVLNFIETQLRPAVIHSGEAEIAGLLAGLDGRFVAPGPSGAPTRGRPEVLPTGRNFYSVDTRAVPTPAAVELGWKSATLLMERFAQDHGDWPKRLGLSAWGTSNMRTGGDDIAQGLALMGVKPTWDTGSRRVTGFEVLPISVLGRPRVDVTLRISGFFRDAFPGLIDLFASAVAAVAALDEDEADNPLAAQAKRDAERLSASGLTPEAAVKRAAVRVFGSMPGAYGAGLQALMDEGAWETDEDLADAYLIWGGYAYGGGLEGGAEPGLFKDRLSTMEAVLHNQDNREHDLLDSDDYYQFEGGMTAAVRHLSGGQPTVYHNDHSRPESPRIRTLEDEIGRVVRARAANPKWIAGVMRHGYKGAFEMAATVDYLFSFQATARCVGDHHFDLLFDAYLGDETVRQFMETHNPDALREMQAKFQEALDRGLWKTRLNHVQELLAAPDAPDAPSG